MTAPFSIVVSINLSERLRAAAGAGLAHLGGSLVVAFLCAALVFGLWYPFPYSQLVGGRELFLLVVSVDVVCGPLLTLIVFDRRKPRVVLWRDVGVIVLIQLVALGYGLYSVVNARPVYLAFERDRFLVVTVPDIDFSTIESAPKELQRFGMLGPRTIGVRLASPADSDYFQSIEMSLMHGLHPAYRPTRWVSYESQRHQVLAEAKPLSELRARHPARVWMLNQAIGDSRLNEEQLGYLPLVAGHPTDWVVLVERDNAEPKAFANLDGW